MLFQEPTIPHFVQSAFDVSIRDATIVSGGFSGAAVFYATTEDGRELAVRRTPRAIAIPTERMIELHRLLWEISQRGCEIIAVPMLTKPGTDALAMSWLQIENNFWQMEPWMSGASRAGHEMTAAHLAEALRALDEFHRLAAESVDALGLGVWFHNKTSFSPASRRRYCIVNDLHRDLLATLKSSLHNDPDKRFRGLATRVLNILQTWLPWLQRSLKELAAMDFRLQPVLRDVWRAHVLFTDSSVTGLIDLTAAGSDHVALDVARLLRSWYGADNAKIQLAVEEFQRLRAFNASERRLLQAFDASTVLLSPVTWLRRRVNSGETADCSDEVIARLTELTDVAEKFRPLGYGI